ncbi:MAG: methyltransferase domain-containing protein, partial [Pedobacter sp.]
GCAMKVNTDGVLLAALADGEKSEWILDIGTGTGLIALMMAQRFSNADVHAVEIDEEAAARAESNFQNSIFNERLFIQPVAIENYTSDLKFDLIISNPPYFINDLRNPEEKKGIARHATEEFFQNLMKKVNELLSIDGAFWYILPVKQAELLIEEAKLYDLYVKKQILLHSDATKPAFRWIICLSRLAIETEVEHFYIYEAEKVHTTAYKNLLKDFFLAY